jgi:putative hydrolase of the HAD superfamily
MSIIRAIICDLDDTLYPERDFVISGYDAVVAAFAKELGWNEAHAGRLRQLFDSPDRPRVFNQLLGEQQVDAACQAEWVSRMVDVYRHHKPRISLHADAERALMAWRGRVRLGLLSDGPLDMQKSKTSALGLESRLDAMIFTDVWGRAFWKPHPRGFEELAVQLNVAPRECAYIGDNPAKDFLAPNRLGWTTIRIVRPGGTYEHAFAPQGGEPMHVIRSLDELDGILTEISSP